MAGPGNSRPAPRCAPGFIRRRGAGPSFERRYRAELRLQAAALAQLRAQATRQRVTLLYGARDALVNHAQVLRAVLLRKPRQPRSCRDCAARGRGTPTLPRRAPEGALAETGHSTRDFRTRKAKKLHVRKWLERRGRPSYSRAMNPERHFRYQALSARDPRFDGIFFVGVTSTGIYCRPICPAKTPKEVNCRFFNSPQEAEQQRFRPCLRCRPELAPGNAPVDASQRIAHTILQRLEEGPSRTTRDSRRSQHSSISARARSGASSRRSWACHPSSCC